MSDKCVRVVGHSKEMNFPFGEKGPWHDFAEEIKRSGFTIANKSMQASVTHLIAHSHSKSAIREAKKNHVKLSHRILVIWEPSIVDERIRSSRILREYGHVFVPSENWNVNSSLTRFKWPQSVTNFIEPDFAQWLNRENTPVIIQANKYSIHIEEKYSLRRQVLKSLEKAGHVVALYGSDWNRGIVFNLRSWISSMRHVFLRNWHLSTLKSLILNYPGYRGVALNKQQVNAQFRCSIVIENSLDYMSEKLFDAVSSGSYVFYVGPNLSDFGLGDFPLQKLRPNANEITRAVEQFLGLDPEVQFHLMNSQRKGLSNYLDSYNNSNVLRHLATTCVTKFTTE
jgi:hypothetical protein